METINEIEQELDALIAERDQNFEGGYPQTKEEFDRINALIAKKLAVTLRTFRDNR